MSNRYLPLISKYFALVLLLMSVSFFTKAQTDYSIGTGTVGNTTTTYPCPIQDYFEGSKAQYLWLASELSAAGMGPGMINSIKFNIVNLNTYSGTIQSYQIKIGGTSVATLGATTWENVPTTVFGPVDYVATAGINTFTFSSPFFWNGTDNIIIEICNGLAGNETDGIIHYTVNPTIPWTTGLSFNGSHTYRADNVGNSCGTTVTTNTGTQTTRPNITFNQTPASACNGTPTGTATIFANGSTPPYTMGLVASSPVIVFALSATVVKVPITLSKSTGLLVVIRDPSVSNFTSLAEPEVIVMSLSPINPSDPMVASTSALRNDLTFPFISMSTRITVSETIRMSSTVPTLMPANRILLPTLSPPTFLKVP